MSFYDFDFYTSGNVPYEGYDYGVATPHSSLSNPIFYLGEHCRQFKPISSSNTTANLQFLLNSSGLGAPLHGISNTKAISLRCWVRSATVAFSTSHGSSHGICAKATVATGAGEAFAGYRLRLGNIIGGASGVGRSSLRALRLSALTSAGAFGTFTTDVQCSGTYNPNTWYMIRLDVIPIGGVVGDRLTAYTSPDGGGSWSQVGTLDVRDESTGYRPWGDTSNRFGVYGAQSSITSSGTYVNNGYIDGFHVRTYDL